MFDGLIYMKCCWTTQILNLTNRLDITPFIRIHVNWCFPNWIAFIFSTMLLYLMNMYNVKVAEHASILISYRRLHTCSCEWVSDFTWKWRILAFMVFYLVPASRMILCVLGPSLSVSFFYIDSTFLNIYTLIVPFNVIYCYLYKLLWSSYAILMINSIQYGWYIFLTTHTSI